MSYQSTQAGVLPAGSVSFAELAALARGSVLRGGSTNVAEALSAKGLGYVLVGDGNDVQSVLMGNDASIAANGNLTLTNKMLHRPAMKAHGFLRFDTGNPTDGDTITIGERVYEFDDCSGSGNGDGVTEGHVPIEFNFNGGETDQDNTQFAADAIAGDASAEVDVYISDNDNTCIVLKAKTAGAAGNAIAIAKSAGLDEVKISAATLRDGCDEAVAVVWAFIHTVSADEADHGFLEFDTGWTSIEYADIRFIDWYTFTDDNVGVNITGGKIMFVETDPPWDAGDKLHILLIGTE